MESRNVKVHSYDVYEWSVKKKESAGIRNKEKRVTEGEENEREREVLTLRELIHYSEVATLSVTLSEIRHLYSTEKVTYNSAQLQTATTHTGCAVTSDIITHSRYTDAAQDSLLRGPETHPCCELFGEAVKMI